LDLSSHRSVQPILPHDYLILAVRSIFQKGSHVTRGFDAPSRASMSVASSSSQTSASAAASVAPEESLVFEGAMETSNQFLAFVEDRNAGKMLMLQGGAKIARGKITDITLDTLDYAVDGAVLHVKVGRNLRGEVAAAASSDNTASTGPGSTPSLGTAASGDASGAPASGSSGGGANDILERLRRRRQQELQGK
jgi:hypothetical protein